MGERLRGRALDHGLGRLLVLVSKLGSYNETYGAMGAVVILMLWLLITAYGVLLGAEIERRARAPINRGL